MDEPVIKWDDLAQFLTLVDQQAAAMLEAAQVLHGEVVERYVLTSIADRVAKLKQLIDVLMATLQGSKAAVGGEAGGGAD